MHDDAPVNLEHLDALQHGAVCGRGAGLNPGNRFESVRLSVCGEYLDELAAERPGGRQVATELLPDDSRTIINHVDSPDIGFNWSINPYRGCEHGCIYCYARPTHETLGFSSGLDFETKIMVKYEAPVLLRRELSKPSWKPDLIMISGVTDPYQPIERDLRLTRRIMEVLADCRNPISVISKNHLITRDIDLFAQLARFNAIQVAISITTLDHALAMKMEPRTSSPADRLRAIRELSGAGIPVAVMMAPIIPGLTDHEIPRVLEAAAEAGARSAGWVLLRLPHQIKALFLNWLAREFPDRASRVERFIREARGGKLYTAEFGGRMRGEGEHARVIAATFSRFKRKYGLDRARPSLSTESFRRPSLDGQLDLFQ